MEHERPDRSRGPLSEASFGAAAAIDATDPALPRAQGLYDPRHEHDSCGVGFIADLKNRKSHEIVDNGLQSGRIRQFPMTSDTYSDTVRD